MYALVDGNNFYVSCERVFRPSLNGVRAEYNAAIDRLDGEQRDAEKHRLGQKMTLEADIARELAGLGIDPHRVATLEREISDLGGLLNSIASNRHEVALWQKFRLESLV